MQTLAEVLSRLRKVQALTFTARSGKATGWDGVGTGKVAVFNEGTSTVVFSESGLWKPSIPDRPAVRFNNVFRWSKSGDFLRLEHLRFGPEHPVLLLDMALSSDGRWREVTPHECKEDCYTASMSAEGDLLRVSWTILGPRKQESILYTYW